MMKGKKTALRTLLEVFVLLALGMAIFFLPIKTTDYARVRYIVGIWFFIEAAYRIFPFQNKDTPLYRLVGRYPAWRDKIVAGLALAAMFVLLYFSVRLIAEHSFSAAVQLALVVGCALAAYVVYYALCALGGTRELRNAITPWFLRKKDKAEEEGAEQKS